MKQVQLVLALLLLLACASLARGQGEPVTEDEARALLRAIETAHAREDLEALLALTANPSLKREAQVGVARLFKKRNYFKMSTRVLDFSQRADGTAEIEFIEVLRSRPLDSKSDVREKARRRLRLQRRAGEVVVIDALQPDLPELPDQGSWSPESWAGTLELSPKPKVAFGSPEGEARVSVRLRLRNLGSNAVDAVVFGLHPFVDELSLRWIGGPDLKPLRHEGAADAWHLLLPEPVAAGGVIELQLDYGLTTLGVGGHARIGPEGAHLFAEGAWLPTFAPTPVPGADRATHDITVVTPGTWSSILPGELRSDERLDDGRRAMRWQSRFPGESVVVVAGPLEHEELRLSDHLVADVWTQPGEGGLRPGFKEALRSMTARYEAQLGPAPVGRLTLVHSMSPGRRAQPAYVVFDDLDLMEAELFERRRERQPLFYIAHQLTHLWLQDGVRPIGGPAQIITEGLCDHLTFDWFDAEINADVSVWHRDRILQLARGKPSSDRAILVTHPASPDHDVFGAGKTLVVLDGFREFAGEERWARILRTYVQAHAGSQVGVGELLEAFGDGDARLESYVASWIVGEGLADISVSEPTAKERVDPETGAVTYEVRLVVENLGLGPVPVSLRTLEDERGQPWREHQLELASLESTVLTWELPNPLRMVEVDPRLVTWQSQIKNDAWPPRRYKPKSFPGQQLKVSERDKARLEELLTSD